MKKIGVICFALTVCTTVLAQNSGITLAKVKQYITKGNNITACHFPQLWKAPSPQARLAILQQWEATSDKTNLVELYQSLYYPLLVDSFGEKEANAIFYGEQSLEPYLAKLSAKEKNKLTATSKRACKKQMSEIKRLITRYPSTPYVESINSK